MIQLPHYSSSDARAPTFETKEAKNNTFGLFINDALVLLIYYLTLNHELPNSKSVLQHFSIRQQYRSVAHSKWELMMPGREKTLRAPMT